MLKVEVLHNYLNSGKITLNILSELYRIAPDGLFLTSLAISANKPQGAMVLIGQAKGNQMVLIGQAKDNQTVLKFANALKISGLITKADVNYITKRKVSAQEMVDFELKAAF
jgi:Tfp pilus assembly protein PilN